MAEHDRGFDDARWEAYRAACAEASTEDLLLVPGMEYEDAASLVHVPVWGVDLPFLGAARPTEELLRDAKAHDAFTVFAHPARRNAFRSFRPEWTPYLDAVEIWNRHYDGIAPYPEGRRFAEEQGLRAFAALDFHTRRQFFPLAVIMEVAEPVSTYSRDRRSARRPLPGRGVRCVGASFHGRPRRHRAPQLRAAASPSPGARPEYPADVRPGLGGLARGLGRAVAARVPGSAPSPSVPPGA